MVIKIVSFFYIVVGRGNLLNISGTIGKWIFQYIKDLSALLSEVTLYREKNIQAQRGLLQLLFAFHHQSYSWCITTRHVELTNLPSKNPSAYKYLQTYGIEASLSAKKFSMTPGDLVTESQSTEK